LSAAEDVTVLSAEKVENHGDGTEDTEGGNGVPRLEAEVEAEVAWC